MIADRDKTIIRLWLAGSTYVEIAKELQDTRARVVSRVSYLRKRGVRLPLRLSHASYDRVDVDALNALIEGGARHKRK